ncbi:MAG: sigma-54-dependent Fis family transcriptional regulator [Fidelibacterota bacterium]|nr:MAG: sigma-54-dependent Fis family transcriptional regulator [Candidatus Neomarinimicrobiota bacterium]
MRIAVVDDDRDILNWFKHHLGEAEHEVITAGDGEQGLKMILEWEPDISLIDLKLPGMDGLNVVEEVLKQQPQAVLIIMTAFGTIPSAVEAMRAGACDYLTKPLDLEQVMVMLQKCGVKIALLQENRLLKEQMEQLSRGEIYITENDAIQQLLDQAKSVAATDSTVLVTGESGTGKEVFAKYIHKNSKRFQKQFVVVNCAALSEQLLESELFGHVKGSFTGAYKDHAGYFEVADGGTIFLDETGELSPATQVKLLRVLQDGEFSRVGETKARRTNVRVIAATNRDLQQLMAEGRIREDFYYRINVFEFDLPPLRERPEDIMFYFERFVQEYATQMNKVVPQIDPQVRDILLGYDWPGNIRELKNIAERTTILCNPDTGLISTDLVPDRLAWSTSTETSYQGDDFKKAKELLVKEFEISFITQHLRQQNGNIAATARKIGVHPVFLRQKIANLGIDAKLIKDESAKA